MKSRLIVTLTMSGRDLVGLETRREHIPAAYAIPGARRRVDGILALIRAMIRAERNRHV